MPLDASRRAQLNLAKLKVLAASAGATRILDKSKFNPVAVIELLRAVLHNGPPAAINVMSHGEPWKG